MPGRLDVAHPHRQMAVGGVEAQLADHDRERIGPGEGRRLDELVLPMLDFALGHRTVSRFAPVH
ncbi:hypothetical protein [Nocardiopsis baichengensis]|uniref:hypothetical protein n=1 Tax=Nocardiopsis baichengensis TaxID=280240 RepID=UPI00036BD55F|nr:hypothetical protein [Nocardiopsis baichengensis]